MDKNQQLDKRECKMFLTDLYKRWIKQVDREYGTTEKDMAIMNAYKFVNQPRVRGSVCFNNGFCFGV